MDILYLMAEGGKGAELTYSLRTLVNLPHDRVFISGGCPSCIDKSKVVHIPTKQSGTKYENSTANLKAACRDPLLSEDFILMNDDFFITQPITDPAKELALNRGKLDDVFQFYFNKFAGSSGWAKGMRDTGKWLKNQGISEPLCYELHLPMIMNKRKVLDMFALPGIDKLPIFHKRSAYGNIYNVGGEKTKDVKITSSSIFKPEKVGKFLSCDDVSFPVIKMFLDLKYSAKSEYEL